MKNIIYIIGATLILTACNQVGSDSSKTSSSSSQAATATSTAALTLSADSSTLGYGEQALVTASGGTSPYTYSIYSGGGTYDAYGWYTAPSTAGTVILMVKDAVGSVNYAYITVTASTITISPATLTLYTGQSYTFSASGGTAPYTYSIYSGYGSISSSTYYAGTNSGSALVKVTDANGRTGTASVTIKSSTSSDLASKTLTLETSYNIGVSWDNTTSSDHPSLVFYGLGSKIDPSYIGDSSSSCVSGGYIQGKCGISVELHNLYKSQTASTVYKGYITITGRSNSYQLEFCVLPNDLSKAYVRWYNGTRTIADIRFNKSTRTFLGGKLLHADHVAVDTASGYGDATIKIEDAGYTNDTGCGYGYSTSYYVQVSE